jgi:peptidoglycan/xylan/chitin deacetylase (PgdA/CDA1 family)
MAILAYEHIGRCPAEQREHRARFVEQDIFASHVAWLRRKGWAGVSLRDVKAALGGGPALPKKWIVITLDGGWRNAYSRALPVLREHGYTATLFVISGRLRRNPPQGMWNDFVSSNELIELRSAGWEIGSYTRTQPKLEKLKEEEIRRELTESRHDLSLAMGSAPDWFSYPWQKVPIELPGLVRDAGYAGAVSKDRDNRVHAGQLYELPRVPMGNDMAPVELNYLLGWPYHLALRMGLRRG